MYRKHLTPQSHYAVVTRYNSLIHTYNDRQLRIATEWLINGLNPREIEELKVIKGKQGYLGRDMIQNEINNMFGDIIRYEEKSKPQQRTNEEMREHQRLRKKLITDNPNACCVACGNTDNLELDHIIAYGVGGTNDESNYQILCKKCHRLKTEKERKEYGWDNGLKGRGKT